MSKTINFVPEGTHRRAGIRGRITLLCVALAAICVVMAYVTGAPSPADCYQGSCWPAQENAPRLVWFFLAIWPGGAALLTVLGSFLFTGRPW